jgi:hypothetical protein
MKSRPGFKPRLMPKNKRLKVMKKNLWPLVLLLTLYISASAQPAAKNDDGREATAVANKLFDAMRAKNAEAIRALFMPEGQLVAIDKPRTGEGLSKTRVFTADAFSKLISEAKAPEFIEKMPQPDVNVFGDLATVYGRYTFHVGDKFSHCGTNTFNLVRTEQGWKIANAASTLEFQCQKDLAMVAVPDVEPKPEDVATIDGITEAFYEVISGGAGQPRQWGRDKTLYWPGVRFVAMSVRDGKPRAQIMSHKEYINSSNEFFVREGFVEREIGRVTRQFGNMAHVFSTYEWETTIGQKARGRGVNSLELFNDGTRWWISAVTWDEERPNNPIPKEFLSKKKVR